MSPTSPSSPQGTIRVQWLSSNAVRITHRPPNQTEFPPDRPWLGDVLLNRTELPKHPEDLSVQLDEGRVRLLTRGGTEIFSMTQPPKFRTSGKLDLFIAFSAQESLYGFGEWFNAFRRIRGSVRLKNQEAIPQLQRFRTYSSIPFFLSSRGYGLWLLNSHACKVSIHPRRGVLSIRTQGPPADYVVFYGPDFRAILKTYTALTGRPPLPPRWAFGLWVTGFPQESPVRILERVKEHRRRQIPLDAVILDYHWQKGFHSLCFRESLVPNPKDFIHDLKNAGVRLGLIFAPFLNSKNQWVKRLVFHCLLHNLPRGALWADERVLKEYDEARKKGFLSHEQVSWWFGKGGMLDFSNPQAADWWGDKLRGLLRLGVSFFKNDDGEYLPRSAKSRLGIGGEEYHNLYGLYYGRAVFEATGSSDDRRPWIYSRSVFAGSQRYPALFLGDQQPSFRHIRGTMKAGLNLSLLGFAYWGADVFGLIGKTSPELHMRYAQWALFNPVARYFWRPTEVDPTRFPWSHEEQVESNFRTLAQLRMKLLPYWQTLAWEAHLTGLPLIRPLLLQHIDEERFHGVYDQVLVGDRLLLAPVVRREKLEREVLLPEGTWHDFWSTQSHQGGGSVTASAPLDRVPLFVKGGSILPLGPYLECIPDDHQFDRLELHCYPPYAAQMIFYDDDGRTRAYQRGEYSQTQIQLQSQPQKVILRIQATLGAFTGQPQSRQIDVVLERSEKPKKVLVDGTNTSFNYISDQLQAIASANCPLEKETTIEFFF